MGFRERLPELTALIDRELENAIDMHGVRDSISDAGQLARDQLAISFAASRLRIREGDSLALQKAEALLLNALEGKTSATRIIAHTIRENRVGGGNLEGLLESLCRREEELPSLMQGIYPHNEPTSPLLRKLLQLDNPPNDGRDR